MNCTVIDACMRLHNFIVDNRNEGCEMDPVDRQVFDDDARRYFSVHPNNEEGVHGGEDDVRRDENGNILRGGRPPTSEALSTETGKVWRDKHRDEIARRGLARPISNWYRERNRIVEEF